MADVKCVICGGQSHQKYPANFNSPTKHSSGVENIGSATEKDNGPDEWSINCAKILGNILFGNATHLLVHYFKTSNFCSTCSQAMKDFQHFSKQLEFIKNHLELLSKDIRNRFNLNYVNNSKGVLNYDVGLSRLLSLTGSNDASLLNNYEGKEVDEMIYAAACKRIQADLATTGTTGEKSLTVSTTVAETQKDIPTASDPKKTGLNSDDIPSNSRDPISVVETIFSGNQLDFHSSIEYSFTVDPDPVNDNDEHFYPETETSEKIPSPVKERKTVATAAKAKTKNDDVIGNKRSSKSEIAKVVKKIKVEPEDESSTNETINKFLCKYCGKAYTLLFKLNKHVAIRHGPAPKNFPCEFCKELKFATAEALQLHFGSKHSKCKNCPLVFETKKEQVEHFIQKHEKNVCGLCSTAQVFKSKKDLNIHIEEVHGEEKDTYCQLCRKAFEDEESFADHKALHRDTEFRCKKCSKGFLTLDEQKEHEESHRKKSLLFSSGHCCSICKKMCLNGDILKKHIDNHSVYKGSHECNICAELCLSRNNLEAHILAFHKKGDEYCCDKCPKLFKTLCTLKKHLYIHEDDRPFKCGFCEKSFKNAKYVKRHERHVHNDRERIESLKFKKVWSRYDHFCQFCGKGFKGEDDLNDHVAGAHQGSNPFSCAFCPEYFSNSIDLKNHTGKQHPSPEDIKRFKCLYCEKSFKVGSYLEDHMKLHGDVSLLLKCPNCPKLFINENEKKRHYLSAHSTQILFTCTICNKGFTYRQAYNTHVRNNHAEKKIKCSICDKMFSNTSRCRNHEATHTGLREFRCQYCDKGYNTAANLLQHQRIVHFGISANKKKTNSTNKK